MKMENYVFIGLKTFTLWLAVMWFALFVISSLLRRYTDIGRDDSDTQTERSDMKVLTDHKTGLQYLATSGGGITPRLDLYGKQIRAELKEKP